MPRTPTDYSKTIIYKIQHIDNPELLYVGSTTQFTKRKCSHKSNCGNPNNKNHNAKLYQMIRDNGNWDMFIMIVVKEFPCDNKREAECEEDKVMRQMKSSLNTTRAFVSPEERQEYQKQYRQKNKEEIAIKDKQRRERNKDKIAERGKIYRTEHKDEIAERKKIYRTEHKDEIAERKKQKITCECCCVITKGHLARHKRTKNHQDLMKSIEQ